MIASRITIVEETGSTNADLIAALRAGERLGEGAWHVARRQSAGRGRQGREWFDGSGNFMGSSLVALRPQDPAPASLSFVAGLAVYDTVVEALSGTTVTPSLKWPNDVLLGPAKLSGILLEMVHGHVIVGIGVNLARAPDLPDRATAAIADFSHAPDLSWFARRLSEHFAVRLETWRHAGLAQTLDEFQLCSIHGPGTPVAVHDQDGSVIEGSFEGLDETDGALRLRLADGSQRVIRAGDIV